MELECGQFVTERGERTRLLHERHERDLEHFDNESARLGFRSVQRTRHTHTRTLTHTNTHTDTQMHTNTYTRKRTQTLTRANARLRTHGYKHHDNT